MKPIFRVWLALVIILVLPWGRVERLIDAVVRPAGFVVGLACVAGIIGVYLELMIKGLRRPPHP